MAVDMLSGILMQMPAPPLPQLLFFLRHVDATLPPNHVRPADPAVEPCRPSCADRCGKQFLRARNSRGTGSIFVL